MFSRMCVYLSSVLALILISSAAYSASEKWGVTDLMEQFAAIGNRAYRYREQKHYSFLKKPAEMTGSLVYKKPDTLEKLIVTPKKAEYRIIGDKLFITKPGKKSRKVLLNNYPELMALSDSLRAMLGGNLVKLKKFFDVELKGTQGSWVVTMTPTDIDLEEKIESVEISGKGNKLMQIVIKETGGDKSVLTVTGGW